MASGSITLKGGTAILVNRITRHENAIHSERQQGVLPSQKLLAEMGKFKGLAV
jgi:hypothetical protein